MASTGCPMTMTPLREWVGDVMARIPDLLRRHQFLLEELVKRDFKRKYKGTVLGMAWSMLNPLLTLLIMWAVFSHFFGASVPHYTSYIFCGTVVFSYFVEASTEGMLALMGNADIFTKVNVPKYLFLVAKSAQTFLNFCLTLVVFLVLCALDGIVPSWRLVALAYPVLMLLVLNLGVGLILSALYVFFRDMRYLWAVVTQLLMYVSAVFYPIDGFPAWVRGAFLLNPIYPFIRYFRVVAIDGALPSVGLHALIVLYALFALALGVGIYRKYDNEFIYYV